MAETSNGHASLAKEDPNAPQCGPIRDDLSLIRVLWQCKALITKQIGIVMKTLVTPRTQPTWSLKLDIFSRVMREGANDRFAASMTLQVKRSNARRFANTALPKHMLRVPIEIAVRARDLGGILQPFDAFERTLPCEWIAHDSFLDDSKARERILLYLHGGGLFNLSVASYWTFITSVSRETQCRVFAVEYRLAPEHPYPSAIHDAVSSFLYLVKDLNIPPENIVLAGDSAGGTLASATLIYLKEQKLPLPGGCLLLSPWIDLTLGCGCWTEAVKIDYIPRPLPDSPNNFIRYYLGSASPVQNYHASPLFAPSSSLNDLPPVLIQAGDVEALRDECVLFASRIRSARLELFAEQPHVWHWTAAGSDAANAAFDAILKWLDTLPTATQHVHAIDEALLKNKTSSKVERSQRKAGKWIFEATDRQLPRPTALSDASQELKTLVEAYQELPKERRCLFVPRRRDRQASRIGRQES